MSHHRLDFLLWYPTSERHKLLPTKTESEQATTRDIDAIESDGGMVTG